jgi:hypothetical protein
VWIICVFFIVKSPIHYPFEVLEDLFLHENSCLWSKEFLKVFLCIITSRSTMMRIGCCSLLQNVFLVCACTYESSPQEYYLTKSFSHSKISKFWACYESCIIKSYRVHHVQSFWKKKLCYSISWSISSSKMCTYFFTILHICWYILVTWYFILVNNVIGASYHNYCEEHYGRTITKKKSFVLWEFLTIVIWPMLLESWNWRSRDDHEPHVEGCCLPLRFGKEKHGTLFGFPLFNFVSCNHIWLQWL